MKTRLELHEKLVDVLGSSQVYFQPPTNVSMKYPAIVYELNGETTKRANNKRYIVYDSYTITHIYKSLKNDLREKILEAFPYVDYDRRLVSDGLYQDVFTIYW